MCQSYDVLCSVPCLGICIQLVLFFLAIMDNLVYCNYIVSSHFGYLVFQNKGPNMGRIRLRAVSDNLSFISFSHFGIDDFFPLDFYI